ncbi:uncharacterized protein PHALS_06495 [Plasmopara halstedii]|uniref:Uncharacterized protein n=1 Tax=Plasmopara halstedii TaxID=4781 RepID=A0A0P1B1W4_PLAHL|nr:uncharacterized protein PHALS_06495 [Plasmopara halstedii]CEG48685.1 hypothetical protein PHALS_06495 [Plasmopara halstedii]|eukprot:XP_024585054.1 hypothetical protein PHALS_06495 [Plasmopara halstedii]
MDGFRVIDVHQLQDRCDSGGPNIQYDGQIALGSRGDVNDHLFLENVLTLHVLRRYITRTYCFLSREYHE